MTRESYALYTGLFLLALIAASVAITLWLGRYGDVSDTYVVTTNGSVSGLVEESTVLYRGVNAGKVVSIRFDPEDVRNILVKINVKKGLPITHGTYAKLRIQGLTGLAQIELGDSGEQPEPLETNPSNPARITMRPSLVDKLSDSGGNILIRAEELIARLNAILNSDGQQRIQHILQHLETSTGKLTGLEDRLDAAFAQVPPLTGSAQQSLHHLDEATRQMSQLLKEGHSLLKDTGLLLQEGKSAAGHINHSTIPKLDATLESLTQTASEMRRAAKSLRDDPQALLYGNRREQPGPGEPGFVEPRR